MMMENISNPPPSLPFNGVLPALTDGTDSTTSLHNFNNNGRDGGERPTNTTSCTGTTSTGSSSSSSSPTTMMQQESSSSTPSTNGERTNDGTISMTSLHTRNNNFKSREKGGPSSSSPTPRRSSLRKGNDSSMDPRSGLTRRNSDVVRRVSINLPPEGDAGTTTTSAATTTTSSSRTLIRRRSTSDAEIALSQSTSQQRKSLSSISTGILRRVSRKTSSAGSIPSDDEQVPQQNTNQEDDVDTREIKKMDRTVLFLRLAVLLTLIIATTVVATLTYIYVSRDEKGDFTHEYESAVIKVAEGFQNGVNTKVWSASAFSAMYTSRYGGNSSKWPNATMPHFQQQAAGQLQLSDGRALSFNPIIDNATTRNQWEAHATESASILGAPELITRNCSTCRIVADGIYRKHNGSSVDDPGFQPNSNYPHTLVPVWQIAPIQTNERAVMFNLHSEQNRMRALDDMLTYKVPVLTAILQLVQDTHERPSSILFYPVLSAFDSLNKTVVGSISIVFSWDTVLAKILPNYLKGVVCVLATNTDQQYTFKLDGDDVLFLGSGDHHDSQYNHMEVVVNADVEGTSEELGVVDNLITYQLKCYPSKEFEDQYVTNRPIIYMLVGIMIFVFTAALFLLYDYLVEHRQSKTSRAAERTSRIVNSMFPAAFRDRLFQQHDGGGRNSSSRQRRPSLVVESAGTGNSSSHHLATSQEGKKSQSGGTGLVMEATTSSLSQPNTATAATMQQQQQQPPPPLLEAGTSFKSTTRNSISSIASQQARLAKSMKKFLKVTSSSKPDYNVGANMGSLYAEDPIADLFPNTSIMFCDLVGFTSWCANQSPHDVFHLLESLFWEFDLLAQQYGVFKLGTIGDCYIAVTGLPDPMEQHASVLAEFALQCKKKVQEVRRSLSVENLNMRFGIHSGPVTAGILRGQKSRFELFGDTINTASRMESTSKSNCIQVSQETAALLRMEGMGSWLAPRRGLVQVKGKGKLSTFWLIPPNDQEGIPEDEDDYEEEQLAATAANQVGGGMEQPPDTNSSRPRKRSSVIVPLTVTSSFGDDDDDDIDRSCHHGENDLKLDLSDDDDMKSWDGGDTESCSPPPPLDLESGLMT